MTTEQNKSPPISPTPWTYDDAGFILDDNGLQVACIDGDKTEGLILAAAPEFLEGAEAAITAYDRGHRLSPAIEALRATVAKARGQK